MSDSIIYGEDMDESVVADADKLPQSPYIELLEKIHRKK